MRQGIWERREMRISDVKGQNKRQTTRVTVKA